MSTWACSFVYSTLESLSCIMVSTRLLSQQSAVLAVLCLNLWEELEQQLWRFSVLDIVGAINDQDDHEKNRNYRKYLKTKLKREKNELVSDTTQLKLTASDSK